MDKEFMEFWGNFFLSAAKGQQQFEDMVKWLHGNFSGMQEVTELFARLYGIDAFLKNTPEYVKFWNAAMIDFQESFREFASMMDLVPKTDLAKANKENEDLKVQIRDLEKTIKQMQALLETKMSHEEMGLKGFQDLMKDQTRQFQEMMGSIGKLFTEEQPAADIKKSQVPRPRTSSTRKSSQGKKAVKKKKPV
ncbi:MAG: hypothetical protein ACP5G0_08455 [Desulfomonilia bacterium]